MVAFRHFGAHRAETEPREETDVGSHGLAARGHHRKPNLFENGSIVQLLPASFRERLEVVLLVAALLYAAFQLVECPVGLCISCNDSAQHFLRATDDFARRDQSHALDRRVEIPNNLGSLSLMILCLSQALRRLNDEFRVELLALCGVDQASLGARHSVLRDPRSGKCRHAADQ